MSYGLSQNLIMGRRLALIRERRQLSQWSVASEFGHPQSWLAKIELGERKLLYMEGVQLLTMYAVSQDLLDPGVSDAMFKAMLDEDTGCPAS